MHIEFEWDKYKNKSNVAKHGIRFVKAQKAFLDKKRIIHKDLLHSNVEKRFYCFGKVGKKILTVRFTYREARVRIIGAGYWNKGKKYMKKKIIYTDEPIRSRKIKDFLPSPEYFVLKKENKKRVTIELSNNSISFFKKAAQKEKASYQVMIRRLLDYYVAKQQSSDLSKFASA